MGLANTGQADYLVTTDDDLLTLRRFCHCRIVTPRQFWLLMQRKGKKE
jgi:predicted nucleic acid-binding protein